MILLADTSLTFEPAYPWSIPTIGPAAMLGVALALTLLTVCTYLGVRQASWRRVLIVLGLRLAALAVVFGILSRPSFALTQLEGVEMSKLLVILDMSASMNVAEADGKSTRWQQVDELWKSPRVERRLRQLAANEKIEIVKYLGADELRTMANDAHVDGPRTDMGVWLHELFTRHGHEKNVPAVAIFSDGADNGTRFPTLEKARRWRGVAPIHAFGVGDPANARFKKDLALTKLDVKPEAIFIKTPFKIEAVLQAPGLDKAEASGTVWIEDTKKEGRRPLEKIAVKVVQEKDQRIKVDAVAPDEAGEYRITVEIAPHPDETNLENNKISTYVQVMKKKINVLWIDRPRVYEPTRIIQLALAPEERLQVNYVDLPANSTEDRWKLFRLDEPYDVIVIGDVAAKQFALGNGKVFERIKEMVANKTGLLMLGGSETFSGGGWREQPSMMSLLPVDLKVKKSEFLTNEVLAVPSETLTPKQLAAYPFLELDRDPKKNAEMWADKFEALDGIAPLGTLAPGATELLSGKPGKELVMAATRAGEGRVVVFAGDSTSERWFGSPEAVAGFTHFWKQLVYWLANEQDRTPLVVKLDKRRIFAGGADVLGFTMALRDKEGTELRGVDFKAKVIRGNDEFPVRIVADRGTFQGAKEPGEYQLVVEGSGRSKGELVKGRAVARFLVAADDVETLRLIADHENLKRIASAAEGRFHPATEEAFLQFLDELAGQVNRESRHKTTHWPDWKRVPATDAARDQLAGLWNSFALVGLLLFTMLVSGEWFLRRWWGMV